jgi:hypothetical protein
MAVEEKWVVEDWYFIDLLRLLDQHKPAPDDPTSAMTDYLCRVVDGYAETIKTTGTVTLDSTDIPFLKTIRSLISSAPKVVCPECGEKIDHNTCPECKNWFALPGGEK